MEQVRDSDSDRRLMCCMWLLRLLFLVVDGVVVEQRTPRRTAAAR